MVIQFNKMHLVIFNVKYVKEYDIINNEYHIIILKRLGYVMLLYFLIYAILFVIIMQHSCSKRKIALILQLTVINSLLYSPY